MCASRVLALLLALAVAVDGASDQTTLRRLWASRAYATKPVPAEWRVDRPLIGQRDLAAFQRWDFASRRISDVITRFGPPDRYLVTTKRGEHDFVIYDLPSGHSVAFYVTRPPGEYFGAGVIIDFEGKLLRLDK